MTSLALATTNEAILEMREATPAHYLVKIDSFSLLEEHGIDKYETGEFQAGGYKWKLTIYPNGHKREGKGYVSVYLGIVGTSELTAHWEVNVVFSICLFNQISCNYLYSLGRTRRFLEMKTEWGCSKFISTKDFNDPSKGYLIDDNCVFGAEVFVIKNNEAITECLSVKDITYPPYKQEIRIPNFYELKEFVWISDEFTAGGRKWKIRVYPNGYGDGRVGDGQWFSAYLNYVDSNNGVTTGFSICLKNQKSENLHIKRTATYCFTTPGKIWGWSSFFDLASMNDPKKGFIVNDCCLLEIELSNFRSARGPA